MCLTGEATCDSAFSSGKSLTLCMRVHCVAWASSQYGGYIPRASFLKKSCESYISFPNLALQLTQKIHNILFIRHQLQKLAYIL
jgi:hypothetical protein